MASWGALQDEYASQEEDQKGVWLKKNIDARLAEISALRNDRNIIIYGSAFLQKPDVSGAYLQITHEEINGFMSSIHEMDCSKGLTLILHTPGGVINAAETIASYLHSKFADIETIIPVYAMSAGTMIALGTNRLFMGRQSQLGPIDPQMQIGNRFVSARSIVDQFKRAHDEISTDTRLAHVWAPILQTIGPALLNECENALAYGERMVASWLERNMFSGVGSADSKSAAVAAFFNDASKHRSHGRRIDRDVVRSQGIDVIDLEDSQPLQDAVLSLYHVITLVFENTPATKIIHTSHGKIWIKNINLST
jgi:hypothetical protein